ncbi:type II secretion system minor pseudopilin GspK [Bowmanella dokdonensis]|uniref:Type II secretion system protein K n=1 Tax=Bowmanella dokdonensis TaxID=751969 RepID=A0A939DKV0_9ALTE|nr:type II secretion system minor pseudopilin GspK [Bowmanella dokdonensis]MBN7823646.1 type II secretion system minor pseudopilin GspK [Bowmanella dokdonensis]
MHHSRGVALILVLLILAMVSVIATEMGSRLQLQARRAGNIKDNNQAYWYAMGAEQFALKSIAELLESANGVIHLNQPWAAADIQFPLEGGGLQARITDMQSCFNLNALQAAPQNKTGTPTANSLAEAFKRLLQTDGLEISSYDADVFRDSVIDWLDQDSQISAFGAEDSDYEAKLPPYLPANNLMAAESELRMVHGAAPQWLDKLLPLVCVLPGNNSLKININTLTDELAPVLHALLGNGISLQDVKGIIASRKPEGFKDTNEFFSLPEITALNLTDDQKGWFDVTSQYFLLQTRTRYNNASFSMSSLLVVDQGSTPVVVRREFGGFK